MALSRTIVATVILAFASQLGLVQSIKNYQVVFDKFEIVKSNYVTIENMKMVQYNQTMMATNCSLTLTKDIPTDAMVDVAFHERLKVNQYSPIPLRLTPSNLCKFIATDTLFYPDVVAAGNFPTKCPIPQGPYHLGNYIVNPNRLPAEMPSEHWLVVVNVRSRSGPILKVNVHLTLKKKT